MAGWHTNGGRIAFANNEVQAVLLFVGRLLLSLIFLYSGISKITGFERLVDQLTSLHLPAPNLLACVAALAELGGALLLILGLRARWGALLLISFTGIATVLFHHFWDLADPMRQQQLIHFLKNVAIIGGLIHVVAFGAGSVAIDSNRDPIQRKEKPAQAVR